MICKSSVKKGTEWKLDMIWGRSIRSTSLRSGKIDLIERERLHTFGGVKLAMIGQKRRKGRLYQEKTESFMIDLNINIQW